VWSLGALTFFVFIRKDIITTGTKETCLQRVQFDEEGRMARYLDSCLELFRVINEDAMIFASHFLRHVSKRASFKEALLQPNELVQAAAAMREGNCTLSYVI